VKSVVQGEGILIIYDGLEIYDKKGYLGQSINDFEEQILK